MPTGYTATLVEKGQTFPEFALTCARAFGALITMREERLDAPIPEKFEPDTYHSDALNRDEKELKRLEAMSPTEQQAYGAALKAEDHESARRYVIKTELEDKRVREMMASVEAWEPPTSEHQGLKDFMLEQLQTTLSGWGVKPSSEYARERLAEVENKEPITYYKDKVESLKWSVNHHREQLQKDCERAEGRTEWVRALRESLANQQPVSV